MIQSNYISNYINVKKYNNDYYKLTFIPHHRYTYKDLREKEKGEEDQEEKEPTINDEKLHNNLSRAKSKIFEYSMCNKFDYFVTLTIDGSKYDRKDLDKYIKDLGRFIRNYRQKFEVNIQYILIPEKHLDGSWHMHGLIKGIPKSHFHINKNGYLDWEEYSRRFGYVSLSKVKNQVAVSKYITKYISKSLNDGQGVTERFKKSYYASRGLKTAEIELEYQISEELLKQIDFDFENKYVKLKDLTEKQYIAMLELFYNVKID